METFWIFLSAQMGWLLTWPRPISLALLLVIFFCSLLVLKIVQTGFIDKNKASEREKVPPEPPPGLRTMAVSKDSFVMRLCLWTYNKYPRSICDYVWWSTVSAMNLLVEGVFWVSLFFIGCGIVGGLIYVVIAYGLIPIWVAGPRLTQGENHKINLLLVFVGATVTFYAALRGARRFRRSKTYAFVKEYARAKKERYCLPLHIV